MFVSFGSSSGPIDAFNILLLSQKGSLYATRPTLAHSERPHAKDRSTSSSRWRKTFSKSVEALRARSRSRCTPGCRSPKRRRRIARLGEARDDRRHGPDALGRCRVTPRPSPTSPSSPCAASPSAIGELLANDGIDLADPRRRNPRPARRERSRQVDAGEDPLRRRRAERRGDPVGRARRSTIASPVAARALGIGMVFQHFSLFDELDRRRERRGRALRHLVARRRCAAAPRRVSRDPTASPSSPTGRCGRFRPASASASRSCAACCRTRSSSSSTSRPRC